METAQAIPDWRAVADEIWALLRESQKENAQGFKELKESLKETDRQLKESQKETDRQLKESQAAVEKQMKQTDKRIGELGNRFGEMVEHMVVPNLVEQFRGLGFAFDKAGPNVVIEDRAHGIMLEIDAFLENGDKVMIVEIKSKPSMGDVNRHVERMEKLRRYADVRNDKRAYLGAIAGVVFNREEKAYALERGFYVIEPSGDTFNITEPDNPAAY
jgi:hypothetical protein